jgi:hypothetical protein
MMIPTTVDRVPLNTSEGVNDQIRRETEQNVARFGMAGDEAITVRLQQLNKEWDIERTLEANAATAALIGLGLGTFVNRRFYAIPTLIAGFLLQHAIQGWCPPVPIFRRLGFRTQPEIERERFALKALRGDFVGIDAKDVQQAIRAVRT